MRLSISVLPAIGLALLAAPLEAQRSSLGLDVTLGEHRTAGGLIDYRTGAMLDVLATARVHSLRQRSLVGGLGASAGAKGRTNCGQAGYFSKKVNMVECKI